MAYKKVKKTNKTQLNKKKPAVKTKKKANTNISGKEVLQPGARGDSINPSMPGYRGCGPTKGSTN